MRNDCKYALYSTSVLFLASELFQENPAKKQSAPVWSGLDWKPLLLFQGKKIRSNIWSLDLRRRKFVLKNLINYPIFFFFFGKSKILFSWSLGAGGENEERFLVSVWSVETNASPLTHLTGPHERERGGEREKEKERGKKGKKRGRISLHTHTLNSRFFSLFLPSSKISPSFTPDFICKHLDSF